MDELEELQALPPKRNRNNVRQLLNTLARKYVITPFIDVLRRDHQLYVVKGIERKFIEQKLQKDKCLERRNTRTGLLNNTIVYCLCWLEPVSLHPLKLATFRGSNERILCSVFLFWVVKDNISCHCTLLSGKARNTTYVSFCTPNHLSQHESLCRKGLQTLKAGEGVIHFKNHRHRFRLPFAIYYDIESIVEKSDGDDDEEEEIQRHEPISVCSWTVSQHEEFSTVPRVFTGETCIKAFILHLMRDVYQSFHPSPYEGRKKNFKHSTKHKRAYATR